MTNSKRILVQLLLLTTMFLASCGAQPTAEATVDVNAVMTQGVGTFVAALTQTQAVVVLSQTASASPTSTLTNTPVLTNTPAPTSTQVFLPVFPTVVITPTVTGTQYTPTVNPSTLASGCNNLLLLRDESIPTGTVMQPGEEFTKIWKVENNGTCDWVYLYRLVFVSGERMEGEPSGLGKVIGPGKWTQLPLGLKAPSRPGTYTGYWRFGNQSGSPFGSTLTVSIVVANPTNTPETPTSYPNP